MTQTTPTPAHYLYLTADTIEYLGKVSEWLRSAPSGCQPYGELFIESVSISFDGEETIGVFEATDDTFGLRLGSALP